MHVVAREEQNSSPSTRGFKTYQSLLSRHELKKNVHMTPDQGSRHSCSLAISLKQNHIKMNLKIKNYKNKSKLFNHCHIAQNTSSHKVKDGLTNSFALD